MIILLELAHNSNFKLLLWILILLLKVYAMLSSFMSTTTQINMQPISLLKLLKNNSLIRPRVGPH